MQSLLQILSDPGWLPIVGAGTGLGATIGSIATMSVQKVLNRKRDKTDIAGTQVNMLNDVNARLDQVVKQLQDIACYREPCKIRINGNYVRKKSAKKNTEE